jgi:hypothetical protein
MNNAAATSRNRINLFVQRENDYLGRPVDNTFIVEFYTEDTRKGVGQRLRNEIRTWSKWFKSCGATDTRFCTRRPQYDESFSGCILLGTFWKVRVTV